MAQWFFYISLIFSMIYAVDFAYPRCAEANLTCCAGTNGTCNFSNGTVICFCDEFCITNNDCCNDYITYCIVAGENNKEQTVWKSKTKFSFRPFISLPYFFD